jgi:uncharacterized integral membrane protein
LAAARADEEEHMCAKDKTDRQPSAPYTRIKLQSGDPDRHASWKGQVEKFFETLIVATFVVGNSAAVLGFLGYMSFDAAMPTIIVCGICGALAAFCVIRTRYYNHQI